ncbi:MAG: beta-galactosidase [Planctomycetota bacterium]
MLRYSVDYYPEQWDESRWETDAKLMRAAGVTSARIAEFSWCRMEPEEGRYDFGWLDRVIGTLSSHGVSVMMCTPTATPPAWLCAAHPEIYHVDKHGGVHDFGTRHQACPNHPTYREYCLKIVTRLARHFAANKAVYAWQLDNEYGEGNTSYCYCDTCRAKFREAMKEKYGTLPALNRAWGTIVWSQEYSDWSQIPPAVPAGFESFSQDHINPSLRQDYIRFMSQSWVEYQKLQIEALKAANPEWLITHNVMPFDTFRQLDYYALSRDLDILGWDNYPRPDQDPLAPGMRHEVCRSLKRRSFWTLEGPPTIPSSYFDVYAPRPGYLRYIAYQCFAHGADLVSSFRWHQPRVGCEQLYVGLLPHSGEPGRLYEELCALGGELARLDIGGQRSSIADVAIMMDYPSQWALDFQGRGGDRYWQEIFRFYRAFASRGIPVHFVNARDAGAFADYKVLVAPMMFVAGDATGKALGAFVDAGGTFIATHRSGVLGDDHVAPEIGAPGALRAVTGVRVLESDGVSDLGDNAVRVKEWDASYKAGDFCDVIALDDDARAMALYKKDYYAGTPAVSVRTTGKGRAYYVATTIEDAFYEDLAALLCRDLALARVPWVPRRVEAVLARDDKGEILFLLNGSDRKRACTVPEDYEPVLGKLGGKRKAKLAPLDVMILRRR